jgi:DNA-binding transcriptional ArsR family regulator
MINRSYVKEHKGHPHYISHRRFLTLTEQFKNSHENEQLISILKNLTDPTKLNIYLLLSKVEEISVSDIAYILRHSHSSISHALSDLKKLQIVKSHRCGKLICYSLAKQSGKFSRSLSEVVKKLIS